MEAINISIIGHDVSAQLEKKQGTIPNTDVFIVKCGGNGLLAMTEVEGPPIHLNPTKEYVVTRAQYEKLLDLGYHIR